MMESSPRPVVAPNFRLPRLLGIFSVIYASELLILGTCLGGYVALMPTFGKFMATSQGAMLAQTEKARNAELADVIRQEGEAKTEKEKFEVAVRRRAIEARPESPIKGMIEINQLTYGDPTFMGFGALEVISGLILNGIMLASGLGLLHWKPWARKLGLWTSAIKIVRLVLLYGFFVIVLVPPFSMKLGKAANEMIAASQQTMGAQKVPFMNGDFFTKMYVVMYTGMGLGVMILGSIYPAIQIWGLTRPAVRSACSGLLKLPKEPGQPC